MFFTWNICVSKFSKWKNATCAYIGWSMCIMHNCESLNNFPLAHDSMCGCQSFNWIPVIFECRCSAHSKLTVLHLNNRKVDALLVYGMCSHCALLAQVGCIINSSWRMETEDENYEGSGSLFLKARRFLQNVLSSCGSIVHSGRPTYFDMKITIENNYRKANSVPFAGRR